MMNKWWLMGFEIRKTWGKSGAGKMFSPCSGRHGRLGWENDSWLCTWWPYRGLTQWAQDELWLGRRLSSNRCWLWWVWVYGIDPGLMCIVWHAIDIEVVECIVQRFFCLIHSVYSRQLNLPPSFVLWWCFDVHKLAFGWHRGWIR